MTQLNHPFDSPLAGHAPHRASPTAAAPHATPLKEMLASVAQSMGPLKSMRQSTPYQSIDHEGHQPAFVLATSSPSVVTKRAYNADASKEAEERQQHAMTRLMERYQSKMLSASKPVKPPSEMTENKAALTPPSAASPSKITSAPSTLAERYEQRLRELMSDVEHRMSHLQVSPVPPRATSTQATPPPTKPGSRNGTERSTPFRSSPLRFTPTREEEHEPHRPITGLHRTPGGERRTVGLCRTPERIKKRSNGEDDGHSEKKVSSHREEEGEVARLQRIIHSMQGEHQQALARQREHFVKEEQQWRVLMEEEAKERQAILASLKSREEDVHRLKQLVSQAQQEITRLKDQLAFQQNQSGQTRYIIQLEQQIAKYKQWEGEIKERRRIKRCARAVAPVIFDTASVLQDYYALITIKSASVVAGTTTTGGAYELNPGDCVFVTSFNAKEDMLHAKFIDSVTDPSYGWLLVPRAHAEQVNEAPDLVLKLSSAYRESVGLPPLEVEADIASPHDISALASSHQNTMRIFGEVRPPTWGDTSNQVSMIDADTIAPPVEVGGGEMMEEGTIHPPLSQESQEQDVENQFRGFMPGAVNT